MRVCVCVCASIFFVLPLWNNILELYDSRAPAVSIVAPPPAPPPLRSRWVAFFFYFFKTEIIFYCNEKSNDATLLSVPFFLCVSVRASPFTNYAPPPFCNRRFSFTHTHTHTDTHTPKIMTLTDVCTYKYFLWFTSVICIFEPLPRPLPISLLDPSSPRPLRPNSLGFFVRIIRFSLSLYLSRCSRSRSRSLSLASLGQ